MVLWRLLASTAIILIAADTGSAQNYSLKEMLKVGDCFRYHLEMNLKGEIHVSADGKPTIIPLEAHAEHDFPERILALNSKGIPEKSARLYETAKATIKAGPDRTERSLRTDRRLQVAQRHNDQALVYAPAGALTREELALTSEHFDTLTLTGLLPQKEVEIGASWKVTDAVAQGLCAFEGLTFQDLTCKLEKVEEKVGHVSVKGTANGIDLGAMVKLKIDANYRFDLTQQRLTSLEWVQKDERDQGPASPASTEESTTKLTRKAIDQPATLTDVALISVPDGFEPPMPMTQLYYRDPKSRYDVIFAREWQTVAETEEHLVMRMLDRGDFVAQVTISPWSRAKPGEHLSGEAFGQQMAKVSGWEPADVLQVGEVPSDGGRWIYRISAMGQLDGVKVLQNFYLVAGPGGEQIVVAFTLTPKQADRL